MLREVGDRSAGHPVRARARTGLHPAGLDGTRGSAAEYLVHQREEPQLGEFGQFVGRAPAGGAGAEGRGVGVVDVGDAVLGSVHQGDQCGQTAEDLPYGELVQRREPVGVSGQLGFPVRGPAGLTAGCWHGTVVGPRGGAALRSGEPGAPAREVHCFSSLVCRDGTAGTCCSPGGEIRVVRGVLCGSGPTYGHTPRVTGDTVGVSPASGGRRRRPIRIRPAGVPANRAKRSRA